MKHKTIGRFLWSRSAYVFWGIIALVVVSLVVFLGLRTHSDTPTSKTLVVPHRSYNLEIADTEAKQAQGLSDRKELHPNNAMLFVFSHASQQCMWMKDMHFSIDMAWLNENKEIIKIMSNVAPDTYPRAFCADKAKYVLEFAAGEAKRADLATGQRLKF